MSRGGVCSIPTGLAHKRELEPASRKLSSIEINGTFYGSQKPESFAKWHDETPDGFVFALKGLRYATNRRVLGEAGETIERFFKSGVMELKDKLVRSTGSSCRRRSWTSRTSRASCGCCRGPWMGARSATHSRSGTPASARPNSSPWPASTRRRRARRR